MMRCKNYSPCIRRPKYLTGESERVLFMIEIFHMVRLFVLHTLRIRQWRKNDDKFTELELRVDDKRLCVNCGHNGRVQSHAKGGCGQCKMNAGCDSSIWK